MTELQDKLRKLRTLKDKTDAVLITSSDPTFTYFTGTKTEGGLFYYDFSKAWLITNEMEFGRLKKESFTGIKTDMMKREEIDKMIKGSRLGIHLENLSAMSFRKLGRIAKTTDITKNIEEARMIKTSGEIKKITEACRLSMKIFASVDKTGSEQEIKARIEYEIAKAGKERAFPTIVASGSRVQYPHHTAGKGSGFPLLIDFGLFNNHYCSDITRTDGSKYEGLLMKAIERAEEAAIVGANAADVDAAARKALGLKAKSFITSLGHGIGVEVHERPYIGPKSTDVIKEGMTFTIEPGIYMNGGLRIENDYLMTKKGSIKLSHL